MIFRYLIAKWAIFGLCFALTKQPGFPFLIGNRAVDCSKYTKIYALNQLHLAEKELLYNMNTDSKDILAKTIKDSRR